MAARRRPTLRDIATSLDLSVNTVSRALAGKDAVNATTRELVRAEADRLGYVPNTMARSLVLKNVMTIGLVITNPSNPFYARLISAIEERGRVHGYSLMLTVTEDSVDNERRATEELMRWGVDGVLGVPVQDGAEHWQRMQKSGIPLVLVNRDLPGIDADVVGVDYENSARQASKLVLRGEPTSIHLVEEDLEISPTSDRIRGFEQVLAEHGIAGTPDTVVRVPTRRLESSSQPWDPADSYRLGQELADTLEPGAAVLTGNDYFALGLYRAFTEAGLRIPDDVAIVGHGDHPFSAYLDPPLSTVALPAAQVGHTAAERLLRLMAEDGPVEPNKTFLPTELIVRGSTPASTRDSRAAEGGPGR